MVQMPYSLFVISLLAGPLAALMGVLLGAFVFHRGRTGKSPVPTVRLPLPRREEPKPEEPARPTSPRLRA